MYAEPVKEGTIRLQKYLAERGVASRRASGEYIRAGRVTINGEVAREPGYRVCPDTDAIALDGTPLPHSANAPRTIVMYKPRGYICSRSSKQGKTVYELLPESARELVPVGRLDKDSEGLLLLSNDGELIQKLTHPRHGHAKTYEVTVSGEVTPDVMKTLRSPLQIDGYRTRPAEVRLPRKAEKPGRTVLEFTLHEGRNRQIRQLCSRAKLRVHRLIRVRMGGLGLDTLAGARWRELEQPRRPVHRAGPEPSS